MMFVVCGSVLTWIEANILKSTAFFERVNLTISLELISVAENTEFLRTLCIHLSSYDMYTLLEHCW